MFVKGLVGWDHEVWRNGLPRVWCCEGDRVDLERLARSSSALTGLVTRLRIVLAADEGTANVTTAWRVGVPTCAERSLTRFRGCFGWLIMLPRWRRCVRRHRVTSLRTVRSGSGW